jgi:hypothetical protein
MSERYTLVFRGEVLEGQHPAVVRKRLGQAGSFDDAQLDRLFSGKPVIVKRDAGKGDAERLRALFTRAGARLQVVPGGGEAGEAPDRPARESPAPDTPRWEVLPPGSDLLRPEERARPKVTVATAAEFTVAEAGADLLVERKQQTVEPPDVSHLKLVEEP